VDTELNKLEVLLERDAERLNRAKRFFGDPVERANNLLAIKRNTTVKEYACGSVALVLDCNSHIVGLPQTNRAGFIHDPEVLVHWHTVLIYKADSVKPHKLQDWDEKLMLVPVVQIVKTPQEWIPSRMGIYRFKHDTRDCDGDLLLVQSCLNAGFKLLPGLSYWEPCEVTGPSTAEQNGFVPQQIETASEVMECIPYHEGNIIARKPGSMNVKPEVIGPLPVVVLDGESVKVVRSRELQDSRIDVSEVFLAPFNLEYRIPK
jgi:hypothetical protein